MNLAGKMLGNRYEIIKKIGEGGMATVYKARCHLLNRDVAIKVLKDEFTTDSEFIKKFNKEAQSAAQLTHPNIVSIYDVGEENNMYYIVMELIKGESLKELLDEKGSFTWEEVIKYAKQIASALNEAHKKRIVHRDIKPHNILIDSAGNAKVADFGIAKAVTNTTVTTFGSTMGSVHYFSPEHAKGAQTDAQSDIYSLGIVMYELLTGKVPFDADTPVSIALKHVQEEPVPPIDIVPNIPEALNYIILKALAKDKALRYANAEEMLLDIECINKNSEVKLDELGGKVSAIKSKVIPNFNTEKKGSFKKLLEDYPFVKWLIAIIIVVLLIVITTLFFKKITQSRVENDPFLPNLAGENGKSRLTKDDAIKLLQELGFEYEQSEEFSFDVPEGEVISQDPKFQERYRKKKGSVIKLVISKGPKKAEIDPKLIGKTKEYVVKNLSELGFDHEIVEEFSEKDPQNIVIRFEPNVSEENKMIPLNTKIKIIVSKGKEIKDVDIPLNLIGKKEEEARKELEGLKLKVKVNETQDATKADGVVISSFPEPGEKVKEGSTVDIYVNKVPKVIHGTLKINVKEIAKGITKPKVELKVILNGEKMEQKEVQTDSISETVSAIGRSGRSVVKVYIDGSLKREVDIFLDQKKEWEIK